MKRRGGVVAPFGGNIAFRHRNNRLGRGWFKNAFRKVVGGLSKAAKFYVNNRSLINSVASRGFDVASNYLAKRGSGYKRKLYKKGGKVKRGKHKRKGGNLVSNINPGPLP